MVINYEELVRGYYDGLVNNLRNFNPGPEFLETWVHDEDPAKSIFGIFEAAKDAKLPELTVTLKSDVTETMDREALVKEIGILGDTQFQSGETTDRITVRFQR